MKPATGFYGKVPTHGDFIRHNLPRSFIDPWDDWLQSAFTASKKQLGEGWLEAYLTSPIYHFVLTPGLCGEECCIGIMMPSVDKVGRYYPLMLGAELDESGNPFHLLQHHNRWFEQAQALALSALEDDFEPAALINSLIPLDALLNQTDRTPDAIGAAEGDASRNCLLMRETLDSPAGLDALYPTLLHNTLREVCHAYSLWWTAGSEKIASSLLISQGLPPAACVAALLAGNWGQRGWTDHKSQLQLIAAEDECSEEPWAG